MKPLKLYLKDFMCYDWAFIDFTQFNSALLVGKTEGNDAEANGVGKTTIFKSIEYVLFNQSEFNIDNIIRDDAAACKVVFDFIFDDKEYRLARTRTRKGSTDLSLYERTPETGLIEEVYHSDSYDALFDKKFWKDISGRRATDTEKDLSKLLKINFKSFRTFVHFVQNDFTGLATATPEKRKLILKDALNLIIYSKLEKLAKEKSSGLSRELDRVKILIENLGSPDTEIDKLQTQLLTVEKELEGKASFLQELTENVKHLNDKINQLTTEHSGLEAKSSLLVVKEQSLIQNKSKLETSIKEYTTKKTNLIQEARNLILEVKQLEETQVSLVNLDYSQMDILLEQIEQKKVLVTQYNVGIKNGLEEIEELKIPLPSGSVCKTCRKPMTDLERQKCQNEDHTKISAKQYEIKELKSTIVKLNSEIQNNQQTIAQLNRSKQHLESINTKIVTKKKEIVDKRGFHEEYAVLLEKFTNELKDKEQELIKVREELKSSSRDEAKILYGKIQLEKQKSDELTAKLGSSNKEITHLTNSKAVIIHNLTLKEQDKKKKEDLSRLMKELETKLGMYPLVIQAFSSAGIPNLIIHNILDDLQIEVNSLLNQFRPGLQLTFSIEKTKGDGSETDTLDIHYQVGGKSRYYEQLSGSMQLMVLFSLKLGISFLLQKLLGVDIKFLLLDELDSSLSKGRVDAFADIIKFLQKDFTVLVITHNDQLKEKFSHAILVEQDINMVSRARVVSSW